MGRRVSSILLFLAILLLGSSFSFVSAEKSNKQLVIIMIDHLSFLDYPIYKDTKGFGMLEKEAKKAGMNINSAGARNDWNAYLTISGGTRGVSSRDIGDSYQGVEIVDEANGIEARQYYYQQTGKIASKDSIVFLSLPRLKQEQNQKYPFFAGITGEVLKQYGIKTKVYGNQDTTTPKRYAPLLLMDQAGISQGDVSQKTLIHDNSRPFGLKTNYDFLYERFMTEIDSGTSLLVFDLGDLYRLDQFKKEMNTEYYQRVRQTVIQEQGQFIEQVAQKLNENQQLLVLSPMVSDQAVEEGFLLAPIWWKSNEQDQKVLVSSTTKRPGIVSNVDIAPTILHYFGIKEDLPHEMVGQVIESVNSTSSFTDELGQVFRVYRQRSDVLYPYVIWQVILLISSILVRLVKWRKAYSYMRMGLIGMLNLPFLFLITAIFDQLPPWLYLSMLLVLSFVIGFALSYLRPVPLFWITGLVTWFAISLDVFFGSFLMKRSYLGYDPIIGARYYGIGNEFMGVYIGAALMFTAMMIHQKKNRWLMGFVALIYVVLSYILLSPSLGTNAGGAISAIVATTFTYLQMNKENLGEKIGWIFLFMVVVGFSILIVANVFTGSDDQSHIGRALGSITNGDFQSIYQLISRKLAMNWKLIRVSAWSKVMISSLFVIGVFFIKPRGPIKAFFEQSPNLFYGFYGIVVGAITALIVNDSGIVAASTMIIYVASPILYIAMEKKG